MTTHASSGPAARTPPNLGEPAFEPPVVLGGCKEFAWLRAKHGARIRTEILHAVLGEPALDLRQRVPVLLRLAILIAEPGLPPVRLLAALGHHGIERDQAVSRETSDRSPQPQ